MNYEIVLQELRAAVDRLDAVRATPGAWGEELAVVLERFDVLDRWLSRGGALPADWTTCRHPAVRGERRPECPDEPEGPSVPRLPGPRRYEP